MLRRPGLWPLLLLAFLAACASGAGGSGGSRSLYSYDLGIATNRAVQNEAETQFNRFGYTMLRSEVMQNRLYIETQWENRNAYADEIIEGATAARSRIIIESTPRGTSNSSGTPLTAVRMRIEVQYTKGPDSNWVNASVPSAQMTAFAQSIAEAFKLELQVKGMEG